MGELTDKIKGNVDEIAGKLKQNSNDPETRDEGAAQEIKGKAEQTIGGRYVTTWKRQADGGWKIKSDVGVPGP